MPPSLLSGRKISWTLAVKRYLPDTCGGLYFSCALPLLSNNSRAILLLLLFLSYSCHLGKTLDALVKISRVIPLVLSVMERGGAGVDPAQLPFPGL